MGSSTYACDSVDCVIDVLHSAPKDTRTRHNRTHICTQEWQQQIEWIVVGYLEWKAGLITCIVEDVPPWDVHLVDLWVMFCLSESACLIVFQSHGWT